MSQDQESKIKGDRVGNGRSASRRVRKQAARLGGSYVAGLAENLPFADRSIQVITAAQCIHWFDIPTFTTEAARVLQPGGIVIATNTLAN